MASIATKPLTAEEFYDWTHRPENQDRHFELEAGEIVEMPAPGERHGFICANAAWILGSYVRRQGSGFVLSNDTGLLLEREPDTVRGPDVALYLETRKLEELRLKYSEHLPALVVEVLSPSDRPARMLERTGQFLAKGVRMVWLLEPETRTVTVARPAQAPLVLESDEELTGADVLPGFAVKVVEFFVMPGEAAS